MSQLSLRQFTSIACFGAATFAHAAGAASLQTITDVWAGNGNGGIAAGCTTYGPIPDLMNFFNGGGFVVLGGNTACGYTGVTSNLTQSSGPMLTSQTLPPTVGFTQPDPECPIDPVLTARPARFTAALSNSFAFGGMNASALFCAV